MPASDRNQTVVIWDKVGYGDDAQPTFGSPRELKVRWVDSDQVVRQHTGELIRMMAVVIVGEDVKLGSVMWLGKLADWTDSGGAGSDKLGEVVFFKKTPDLKGRTFRRKADLQFFKGSFTG